jgi:carbazole 1,9a-dioxygenase terminal dioxygenase component
MANDDRGLKQAGELIHLDDTEATVDAVQHAKPYLKYLEASLGLRNHWYPALFARELKEGEVKSEVLLGERVLFKRVEGKVYAIEDRCAHRGVPFSSKPECYSKNSITCWFHGYTYDVRDGKLIQVLTEPGSNLVGKVSIKSYPVEEVNDVVFVFIGDMSPPPPVTDDIQPRFLTEGMVIRPLARHKVKANWRLAAEEGWDSAHVYGHRDAEIFKRMAPLTIPLSTHASSRAFTTVKDQEWPKGVYKRDNVSVWSADIEGVQVVAPNVDPNNPPPPWNTDALEISLFLPCGLQARHFPAAGVYHFEWYVPVDEEHHMYTIAQGMVVDGPEQKQRFFEDCEKTYGPLIWTQPGTQPEGLVNFDVFIREQMQTAYGQEDWWNRERLYKPDLIIVQWRMLVAKHMRGLQRREHWTRADNARP